MVVLSVVGSEKWTRTYEFSAIEGACRLKCFPFCQRKHRSGASCTQSIEVKLSKASSASPSELTLWAEIVPEGFKQSAVDLPKNAKAWAKEKRHYLGEVKPSKAAEDKDKSVVFEVNKEKRGWLCKFPQKLNDRAATFVVQFHVFKKGKSRFQLMHMATHVSKPFRVSRLRPPSAKGKSKAKTKAKSKAKGKVKAKATVSAAKLRVSSAEAGKKRKADDRFSPVMQGAEKEKKGTKKAKDAGRVKVEATKAVSAEEVTKGLWSFVLLLQYSCNTWDPRTEFCKDPQEIGAIESPRVSDEDLSSSKFGEGERERANLGSLFSDVFEGETHVGAGGLKFNDEDLLLPAVKSNSVFQLFGSFLVEEDSVGETISQSLRHGTRQRPNEYEEKKVQFYRAIDGALNKKLARSGMTRSEFDKEVVRQLINRKKQETPEEATNTSKQCILTYKQLLRFIDSYEVVETPEAPRVSHKELYAKDPYCLSGEWTVPEEFLDYSESVRSTIGMSRVLVAVMRQAEKQIVIKHTAAEVDITTKQRLFSNGRHVYPLSGKDFLWTFPSPLPWYHRAAEKYSAWIDKSSKALMIKTIFNEEFYSFTMYKRRSLNSVDLTAVFYKLNRATGQFSAEMSVGTKLSRTVVDGAAQSSAKE